MKSIYEYSRLLNAATLSTFSRFHYRLSLPTIHKFQMAKGLHVKNKITTNDFYNLKVGKAPKQETKFRSYQGKD